MSVYLNFLLILTGLTGILSITTVSEVSVKAGGSVSIPCLYDSQYENHVKYLCKGYYYFYCSHEVQTNIPSSSGKFSISDDKSRRIFTVTINDVTDTDTDYWCAVYIDYGYDEGQYFHLSVTRDTPSLYVDHQEVTGTKGGNITISCHYSNPGEMKWCKLGSSCVTKSSGSIHGTTVTISASVPKVFTVTLSGLRTKSSGWYMCVKGDLQMPVHVTVMDRSVSATTVKLLTIVPPTPEHENLTPVSTSEAPQAQGGQPSPSDHLKSFSIRLSVLIFVVMVTLFIWFIVKRYKQAEVESSATEMAEGEVRYVRNTSGERSHAESCDVEELESSGVQAADKLDQL